jgi:hypothetical protein
MIDLGPEQGSRSPLFASPFDSVLRESLFAPFLNSRKPVLEGVHVARRSALAFHSCHARSVLQRQHFLYIFWSRYTRSVLATWQDSFSHSCLLMAK